MSLVEAGGQKLLVGPPAVPSTFEYLIENVGTSPGSFWCPCEMRGGFGQLFSTGNRHVPLALGPCVVIEAVCGAPRSVSVKREVYPQRTGTTKTHRPRLGIPQMLRSPRPAISSPVPLLTSACLWTFVGSLFLKPGPSSVMTTLNTLRTCGPTPSGCERRQSICSRPCQTRCGGNSPTPTWPSLLASPRKQM